MPLVLLHKIQDALRNGLVNGKTIPANAEVLAGCRGARLTPRGLEPYEAPRCDVPFAVEDWPGEQLLIGQRTSLIVSDDALYAFDPTDWSKTGITPKLYSAPATDAPITTGGGYWDFMDFGTFWLLINDENLLVKYSNILTVLNHDGPRAKTGVNFRTRGLLANFGTDWADEFDAYWTGYLPAAPPENLADMLGVSLGPNTVAWDSILGGNLMLWLDPIRAQAGYLDGFYGESELISGKPLEVMRKAIKQNQFGFMDMPWPEGVTRLVSVDSAVLVVSTDHVDALVPVQGPFPTFGHRGLLNVGIPSRGAICSSGTEAVFVDTRGRVWHIANNLQPELLGFENIFEPLVDDGIVVSYDPLRREFYLCTGDAGYVLNQQGLAEIPYSISSLAADGQTLLATRSERYTDGFAIETNSYDLGTRLPKNLTGVRVRGRVDEALEAALMYRAGYGEPWRHTAFTVLGPDGYAPFPGVSAVEYRVLLQAENAAGLEVDYVEVLGAPGHATYLRSLA